MNLDSSVIMFRIAVGSACQFLEESIRDFHPIGLGSLPCRQDLRENRCRSGKHQLVIRIFLTVLARLGLPNHELDEMAATARRWKSCALLSASDKRLAQAHLETAFVSFSSVQNPSASSLNSIPTTMSSALRTTISSQCARFPALSPERVLLAQISPG